MRNTRSMLICLLLALTLPSFAQTKHKYQAGVSLTREFGSDGNGLLTGYGLTFNYNFNKNIAIESGAFYRPYNRSFLVTSGSTFFTVKMEDHHISVPVMFRYNNKIINVAAGPSFDFYVGYKQTSFENNYTLDYKTNDKINFGAQSKISKTIFIRDQFVFEPEVRLGVVFPTYRAFLGLGLTLKYGFN